MAAAGYNKPAAIAQIAVSDEISMIQRGISSVDKHVKINCCQMVRFTWGPIRDNGKNVALSRQEAFSKKSDKERPCWKSFSN